MNRVILGISVGICAGTIDVIPMLIMKLPWRADLSAFSMWVVIGFLLVTNNLKLNGIIKGIIISFLVLAPCAIIISSKGAESLIPITITTILLGSISGFIIDNIIKNKQYK
jgi:hypothetical protein